VTSFWN